ncbi:hypothetical protein DUI87_09543 [Hirundo rustica rustica]|uniref:Ig-like domain-containing protein n=1 Tax=Hirundo rustica rustica TaxID=333673 RepID=A0A3M0L5A2_HIRRU|nr:hypothetical protein DUI87_09543 [Hirundo rustica rustica]
MARLQLQVSLYPSVIAYISSLGCPPRISDKVIHRQSVRLGRTIKLLCPVEGDPPPLTMWMKDGRTIHSGWTRFRILQQGLKIKEVESEDAGTYICKATNGFGSTNVNYTLIVIDRTAAFLAGEPLSLKVQMRRITVILQMVTEIERPVSPDNCEPTAAPPGSPGVCFGRRNSKSGESCGNSIKRVMSAKASYELCWFECGFVNPFPSRRFGRRFLFWEVKILMVNSWKLVCVFGLKCKCGMTPGATPALCRMCNDNYFTFGDGIAFGPCLFMAPWTWKADKLVKAVCIHEWYEPSMM